MNSFQSLWITWYILCMHVLSWLALFLKTNGVISFSFFSCKCILINKDWDLIWILNSWGSYILVEFWRILIRFFSIFIYENAFEWKKKDFTPLVFKNRASHVIHKDWNEFMQPFMQSSLNYKWSIWLNPRHGNSSTSRLVACLG